MKSIHVWSFKMIPQILFLSYALDKNWTRIKEQRAITQNVWRAELFLCTALFLNGICSCMKFHDDISYFLSYVLEKNVGQKDRRKIVTISPPFQLKFTISRSIVIQLLQNLNLQHQRVNNSKPLTLNTQISLIWHFHCVYFHLDMNINICI